MDESVKGKPNIATILGVECDQWFSYRDGGKELTGLYVGRDGIIRGENDNVVSGIVVCACVNHPENIFTKPKLTDAEMEICCSLGARYITADACGGGCVKLWKEKPRKCGDMYIPADYPREIVPINDWHNIHPPMIALIDQRIFPSVHSRDCIEVE